MKKFSSPTQAPDQGPELTLERLPEHTPCNPFKLGVPGFISHNPTTLSRLRAPNLYLHAHSGVAGDVTTKAVLGPVP